MNETIHTPIPPADKAGFQSHDADSAGSQPDEMANAVPQPNDADSTASQPNDVMDEHGAMTVPPPVPQREPGFFRRLFMTRKKRQSLAVQNGYLEMVDLIRAIRSHLDRQETVQTRVLTMLEKVPDTMERQHEVMSLFKQQLENNMENDRQLTDSMGRLSGTLDTMNDAQKASSRTITDLIGRSRETEQLLREVMRRAERRMTFLIIFFILLVIGVGGYLIHWQNRSPGSTVQAESAVATGAREPAEAWPASAGKQPEAEAEPEIVTEPDTPAEPVVETEPVTATEPTPPVESAVAAEPAMSEPPLENLPPAENTPAATRAEAKDASDASAPPSKPRTTKKKKRAPSRSKAASKSTPETPETASSPAATPMTEPTPAFVLSPALPLSPEAADLTLAPLQEALDEAAEPPEVETPVSLP